MNHYHLQIHHQLTAKPPKYDMMATMNSYRNSLLLAD